MKVLEEREQTHGDYSETARMAQALKKVMRHNPRLSDVQKESLDMICVKLARIVCGNPDDHDHWLDLAGYAMLVHRDLIKELD